MCPWSSIRALRRCVSSRSSEYRRYKQNFILILRRILHPKIDHRERKNQSRGQQCPCWEENVKIPSTCVSILNSPSQCTYGVPAPSALQTPAPPADWIDLSVPEKGVTRCCFNTGKKISLTKADEMRQFCGVIGHRSDQPIYTRLPHRIKETTKNIEDNFDAITWGEYIHLLCIGDI